MQNELIFKFLLFDFFDIASLLSLRRGVFFKFMLSFLARGICSLLLCCRFDSHRVLFLIVLSLYAVTLIRTVSYIFSSVRSAGGTFVD